MGETLKIAKAPGDYDFTVKYNTFQAGFKSIKVKIYEDMITPVKITITNVSEEVIEIPSDKSLKDLLPALLPDADGIDAGCGRMKESNTNSDFFNGCLIRQYKIILDAENPIAYEEKKNYWATEE